MNRLNPRTWSLATQLFLGLFLTAVLPLIALILFTVNNRQNNTIERAVPYVIQLNLRQQQAIQHTFQLALVEMDRFMADDDNLAPITQALQILQTEGTGVSARSASELARQTFRRTLLGNEENFFDAAYLLTRTGLSTALTTAVGRDNPIVAEDMSSSEIFSAGRDVLDLTGAEREFNISERGDALHLELISPVITADGSLGYIVVTLNQDTLIYNHIAQDPNAPAAYSFLILLARGDFFALPELRDTITFNSIGAQRAIRREASAPNTYITGIGDNSYNVLGYHTPLELLNKQFALVTELPTLGIIRADQVGASIGLVLSLIGVTLLATLVSLTLSNHIENPLKQMQRGLLQMGRNDYNLSASQHRDRKDIIGTFATTYETTRLQIAQFVQTTTERLEARTRDVRVTQDIGRTITAERDLQRMMNNVVDLIIDSFPTIYHAQVFLADDNNFAVLRASTGEPGRQLLERGHKLEIGSVSVIGQLMEQGHTVVARDTAFSDVHRRNEYLPETRAELAIPLRIEDRIIGALDVQSRFPDAFTDDQIAVLETLANGIAVAIENVRLFEESYRRMRQVEIERRNRARLDWDTYLRPDEDQVYTSRAGNITSYHFEDLRRAVYQNGQSIVGGQTPHGTIPFAVPIRLRNQILGVAEYELAPDEFRYDKVLLAEELVNRLAISLDNARLFRESQLAAERERIVNDITAKLQGQTDVESILNTAVREVSLALKTGRVGIELTLDDQNGHPSQSDEERIS